MFIMDKYKYGKALLRLLKGVITPKDALVRI